MFPNLPIGTRLDINPTHFLHGVGEFREEVVESSLKELVHNGQRVGVLGQSRVGLEQSSSLQQETVVAEIEGLAASRVHFHLCCVVVEASALSSLQVRRVFAVQRRVLVASAAKVVQTLPE